MRIFVTGSTGYIGSAVVRAAVKAGHHVGGLYRNPEKEEVVRSLGATPIFGHLRDPETYQHFAAECDAVIHAAFESPDSQRATAETLLSALIAEGENKTFVFTSTIWILGNTGPAPVDETGSVDAPSPVVGWLPALERYVLNGGNEQIATSVIRPGIVYGARGGIFSAYFASAVKDGVATYVGDGRNHTAPVHVEDLAQLYLLVAERRCRGVFHGVEGTQPAIQEVAATFSRAAGKNGDTRSWPVDAARREVGAWIDAMTLDQRIVTTRSKELGWKPRHTNVIDSAAAAFAEWQAR